MNSPSSPKRAAVLLASSVCRSAGLNETGRLRRLLGRARERVERRDPRLRVLRRLGRRGRHRLLGNDRLDGRRLRRRDRLRRRSSGVVTVGAGVGVTVGVGSVVGTPAGGSLFWLGLPGQWPVTHLLLQLPRAVLARVVREHHHEPRFAALVAQVRHPELARHLVARGDALLDLAVVHLQEVFGARRDAGQLHRHELLGRRVGDRCPGRPARRRVAPPAIPQAVPLPPGTRALRTSRFRLVGGYS